MAETLENIPVDQVHRPNRDERLHPDEEEDEEEWEAFKASVGTDPLYPPLVKENGSGYEIVVGDRRFRAMTENGAETVDLRLLDGDEMDEAQKYVTRVVENHHRKENNKEKEAWYAAQFTSPWMLPPAERWDDVDRMTKGEYADMIDYANSGSVSNLIHDQIGNDKPLRYALGKKAGGRSPNEDDIETIDNIVALLNGQEGHKVIATGEDGWVADKLEAMDNVSLGEIETMAQQAVEEGMSAKTFLEETKATYDATETTATASSMSSQPLAGDDPFTDTTPTQTRDEGTDAGPAGDDETGAETDIPELPDLGQEVSDVDLDDVVTDDLFRNGTTAGDVKVRKYQDVAVQDDAAVVLNALAEAIRHPDETDDEAMDRVRENIVEPLLLQEGTKLLTEHFADE